MWSAESRNIRRSLLLLSALLSIPAGLAQAGTPPASSPTLGDYFAIKKYAPQPLPRFAEMRDQLPAPILDEKPSYIAMYWKAWELAFKNFHEPQAGSGFVSQFIDAAFNENIFQWDTCFMTMFCNVAHPLAPGIASLDNFYAKQHADGEICREICRATGTDCAFWVNKEHKPLFSRWGWGQSANAPVIYQGRMAPATPPQVTLDGLNHPILAWAEWESYRVTGDKGRLAMVYEPLKHYYGALQTYLRQGNGLYITDWASMDNSPRNIFLAGGGCAVDTSCEMALFARNLAAIAGVLGQKKDARHFAADADALSQTINRLMWDKRRHFYFDLALDGRRAPVKTVAAFWALLAGVASREQAACLAAELGNPKTFARAHRVPTLAADETGYNPAGGYWCGAVWAPTTTMVIRGLTEYGFGALSREIALNDLDMMNRVFQQTGTIWENYAPDAAQPGRPAKADFVGWSGLGPILYLLEFGIGLRPEASKNQLLWEPVFAGRQGCERYRFNGHVVSLLAQPALPDIGKLRVTVKSDGEFTLFLKRQDDLRRFHIRAGEQTFEF